jgi:predicted O-linked N-acetylglucosamine transferase (SPINDLY family)
LRADGIEVLVDLGGHLAGNRLAALASAPAPVQVSYLGYPGGTGLPVIAYRLVDAVTAPAGAEADYSEVLALDPDQQEARHNLAVLQHNARVDASPPTLPDS